MVLIVIITYTYKHKAPTRAVDETIRSEVIKELEIINSKLEVVQSNCESQDTYEFEEGRPNIQGNARFYSHKHQHNRILSDVELAVEINNDKYNSKNDNGLVYTGNDSIDIVEGKNGGDDEETKINDNNDIKLEYVDYYHDHIMEWNGKKYNHDDIKPLLSRVTCLQNRCVSRSRHRSVRLVLVVMLLCFIFYCLFIYSGAKYREAEKECKEQANTELGTRYGICLKSKNIDDLYPMYFAFSICLYFAAARISLYYTKICHEKYIILRMCYVCKNINRLHHKTYMY